MLFGIYLVENGVLSCEDFYEALKLQLRSRPQLGALAIELRKLTARDVFAVLRRQCHAPEDRFGDLAVEMGYLTPDDLGQLVHEQSLRVKPFQEILVEGGFLPAEVVERHAREYRWTMEQVEESELTAAR